MVVLLFFLPPAVLPDLVVVGLAFFVTLVDVFANAEPGLAVAVALGFAGAGAAAGFVAAGAAAVPGVAAAAAGFLVESAF